MARVSYPDPDQPGLAEIVGRIRSERGRVLNLYGVLLNSPPIAEGWLHFLTAIRQKSSLSGRIRELVILQVAVLNRAPYEFDAHVPFALREGIPATLIEALRAGMLDGFADDERAVLRYTECMTRDIQVPDAVFAAIRPLFNDRELVELTATVAAYNLVSRFLEALAVDHQG